MAAAMAPPRNAPDSQTLASKDATLFRQLVRFYEGKQYKKGIKNADQVRTCAQPCMSKDVTLNGMHSAPRAL